MLFITYHIKRSIQRTCTGTFQFTNASSLPMTFRKRILPCLFYHNNKVKRFLFTPIDTDRLLPMRWTNSPIRKASVRTHPPLSVSSFTEGQLANRPLSWSQTRYSQRHFSHTLIKRSLFKFFLKYLHRVIVWLAIQFLLPIDSTIWVVIKYRALPQNPGVTLSLKFGP